MGARAVHGLFGVNTPRGVLSDTRDAHSHRSRLSSLRQLIHDAHSHLYALTCRSSCSSVVARASSAAM